MGVVGPSNLITSIQSTPPYWAPIRSIFDKQVGKVESEAEFVESRSPLFQTHLITRLLLIAQGTNNPRFKQVGSDQIVAEMRKNRQQVEYPFFPDEGHGTVSSYLFRKTVRTTTGRRKVEASGTLAQPSAR